MSLLLTPLLKYNKPTKIISNVNFFIIQLGMKNEIFPPFSSQQDTCTLWFSLETCPCIVVNHSSWHS